MIVTLPSGKELRGDLMISCTIRYDLTPIPATCELVVKLDDEQMAELKDGAVFKAGFYQDEFAVIHAQPEKQTQGSFGGHSSGTIKVIGFLNKCLKIAHRQNRAIIRENTSLAAIYKAAGAQIEIGSDIRVPRFSCFVGHTPSYYVTQAIQEASALIKWDGKKLNFMRLSDAIKQKPLGELVVDTTRNIDSGFLSRHEVARFFSIDDDGRYVEGNSDRSRALMFLPNSDVTTLKNASRVLVNKKISDEEFQPKILAGDVFTIEKRPFIVMTAAHHYQSTNDGQGNKTQSRLWLGEIEE